MRPLSNPTTRSDPRSGREDAASTGSSEAESNSPRAASTASTAVTAPTSTSISAISSQLAGVPPRPRGDGTRTAMIFGPATPVTFRPAFGEALEQWVASAAPHETDSRRTASERIESLYVNQAAMLELNDLGLTSLPDCLHQLMSLRKLVVTNNELTALPGLPPFLENLHANNNHLASLPALPETLRDLYVPHNRLTQLPTLPSGLVELHAGINFLEQLPALPASLTILMAADNRLSSLPELTGSLRILQLDDNRLTVLPASFEVAVSGQNCNMTIFDNPLTTESIARIRALPASVFVFPDRPEVPPSLGLSLLRGAGGLLRDALGFGLLSVAHEAPVLRGAAPAPEARAQTEAAGHPAGSDDELEALFGSDDDAAEPSLCDVLERWLVGSDDEEIEARLRAWQPFDAEQNASEFKLFLDQMSRTQEYREPATRAGLIDRVNVLLEALHASPALRQLCFELAVESTITCGDRIALTFNSMEMARINHEAEQGRYSTNDLFDICQGMFRLHVLDQLAVEKIASLKAEQAAYEEDSEVDEVEVRLGFQTLTAAELQLPGVARAMLFERCALISAPELSAAIAQVRQREQRNEFVQFLARWEPWQRAMQRHHPQPFARMNEEIETEREALLDDPPCMSDQDLLQAFTDQQRDEDRALVKLTARLTRQFLKSRTA